MSISEVEKVEKKRVKRNVVVETTEATDEATLKVPKKRGRKPKGGKIIKQPVNNNNNEPTKPNVILHLKCSLNDVSEIQMWLKMLTGIHFL